MRKEIHLTWYDNAFSHDVRNAVIQGANDIEYLATKLPKEPKRADGWLTTREAAASAAKRLRGTCLWLDNHIIPQGKEFRHLWKDYGDVGLMYCMICKKMATAEDLDIADSLGVSCWDYVLAERMKKRVVKEYEGVGE